jgi:hypothetical protein
MTTGFGKQLLALVAAGIFAAVIGEAQAQSIPGRAEVRAIKGAATVSTAGGPFLPLKVGAVLQSGATIKTGKESVVDIFLGSSAGVVRVTENSTLALDKLTLTDLGIESQVDVQLNLPEGEMLFNVNKLSRQSRYEIKLPNGVAGIRGTQGRCNANSTIVLLNGTLIFIYVPPGPPGTVNPIPYTLIAPPGVIFTPTGGVQLAPPELLNFVRNQFGALGGRLPPLTTPPPGGKGVQDPAKPGGASIYTPGQGGGSGGGGEP